MKYIKANAPEYISVSGALLILAVTLGVCYVYLNSDAGVSFAAVKSMVEHILMSAAVLTGGVAALQYAVNSGSEK